MLRVGRGGSGWVESMGALEHREQRSLLRRARANTRSVQVRRSTSERCGLQRVRDGRRRSLQPLRLPGRASHNLRRDFEAASSAGETLQSELRSACGTGPLRATPTPGQRRPASELLSRRGPATARDAGKALYASLELGRPNAS